MTDATLPRARSRRFPHVPKRMIFDYGALAAFVMGPALIAILLLTVIVSFFRPIEASGWDLAQQIANWFVLGTMFHVGVREFWLYVTHGQTRRNFFGEVCIFIPAFAVVMAVCYSLGFWVEAPLYALMGWPQAVHEPTLYTSVFASHMVLLESWLTYTAWGAAGVFIGMAFYRNFLLGFVAIGVCILFAQLVAIASGQGAGPVGVLVRTGVVPDVPNLLVAVLAHLAVTAVMMALTWPIMRDAPIHARAK